MQLNAGRMAQEDNRRKNRHGAFWEDRYHVTAIQAEDHLHQCVVYIDLDMVRAGVAKHPREWGHSGDREIHKPPSHYGIIDLLELNALFGFADAAQFQETHRQWIEQALTRNLERENRWSEAIAVGSLAFVENVKSELGSKAMHRDIEHIDGAYTLRDQCEVYDGNLIGDTEPLRLENPFLWDKNAGTA